MMAGPPEPRASKLSTTPPRDAYRCCDTNASAPHRHASSASVKTNTMSLRGCGPRSQRSSRLEQGGHAGAVVVAPVRDLNRVVVGHHDDLAGGVRTGQERDHVADMRHGETAQGILGADRLLDLGLQAKSFERRLQIGPDLGGGRAAGHVYLGAYPLDVLVRPTRAELVRRRRRWRRRGRVDRPEARHSECGEGGEGGQSSDDRGATARRRLRSCATRL